MMMCYTHAGTDSAPQESVDYSLKTLEEVRPDESSAAPPDQPDISLFVKVRLVGAAGATRVRRHVDISSAFKRSTQSTRSREIYSKYQK